MQEREWLASQFEQQRSRLRAVAYRMLGSLSEADDAVQDTWLRLNSSDADIENLPGWLTTVVCRVCLNALRSRSREFRLPDPIVTAVPEPEQEAELSDSVGLAMLIVLDTLNPAERLAFVLHDMFAVPFEDIAPLVERTPDATRQLASRARRRVAAATPAPSSPARQREVVDAFFAASRNGDFEALVAVLDPDVILRSDGGSARPKLSFVLRGPAEVAGQALMSARLSPFVRPALINGSAGVVVAAKDRPLFVMGFTVGNGRIVSIEVLADPDRLAHLDLDRSLS
jgi:RNA polymerase sigma factor (sigma-70 family)